jgi:hypothetical protein
VAARNSFISALADTVRAEAPKQLTFSGTEGFFAAGELMCIRPGDSRPELKPKMGVRCSQGRACVLVRGDGAAHSRLDYNHYGHVCVCDSPYTLA